MPDVYWPQIRDILSEGVPCMRNKVVATDQGVFTVDLADYKTVKALHSVIAAAINAWKRGPDGNWVIPPKRTKAHAMPPNGPLPVDQVDTFLAWVNDGMPENDAIA